jgi:hypothetical protein
LGGVPVGNTVRMEIVFFLALAVLFFAVSAYQFTHRRRT